MKKNREETAQTIIVLSLSGVVAYFLSRRAAFLIFSAFLLASAALGLPIAGVIARAWMRFARALGRLNTRIALFLAFYLALTPLALLARLFNKSSATHFTAKRDDTYFHDVNVTYTPDHFRKLW